MRKIILFVVLLFSFSNVFASEFKTNFTQEIFESAQDNGKIVVIYSWNKYCGTCAKQKPILEQAKKDFKDILFLSIEHVENKNLVKNLKIEYWSTIAVYKNSKQTAKIIGLVDKDKIYSFIKKEI